MSQAPIKKILCPVDGSDQSGKALDFAVDLAKRYPARLELLFVTQPLMTEDIFAMGTLAIPVDLPQEDLEQYGQRVLDKAEQIANQQGVTDLGRTLRQGDPAGTIIDYAQDIQADMIVIGSRGLGDLSSLLMGSVSHKVAHDAKCTCVTVK